MSICFSVIFVSTMLAPSIIVLIDDSIDVSIFYSVSDEEEKECEKNKDIEKVFFDSPYPETVFSCLNSENELEFILNTYSKPHLGIIFPPPKMMII